MFFLKRKVKQERAVIFLHLPKCAGSTLSAYIRGHYKPRELYHINGNRVAESMEEFKALSAARRRKIKVLYGHQLYGLHEHFPEGAEYITCLRDPVERVISHYFYVRRTESHYLHKRVVEEDLSLFDYVANKVSAELNDSQTRMLAGKVHEQYRFGEVPRELLDLAKEHIDDHFAVVGVQEQYDAFLDSLRRKYGWEIPGDLRVNVTGNRPARHEFGEETLELIRKYNLLDLELYYFVREKANRPG